MKNIIPLILLLTCPLIGPAQSVDQLAATYSGKLAWDQATATLRFTSSGNINFAKEGARSFIWQIPADVKQIRIAKDVTVNGAFHSKESVSITGEDRKTSVIYGTDEQRWSQNRDIKAFTICTFQNFGGVMTLSNLTSLNPRGFHVRGWDKVVHAVSCDFLDRRGGHHNNSDGFEGGDGSTVHACYFESGDDIIKVYHDVTVTDTTIKMITNTVPIQLGWGNYSDGAVGTFRNLRVLGSGGRGAEGNAIISGRQGRYAVTVNIDGCHIENPNGTLVSLREDTMTLRGTITNAHIRLKSYAGEFQRGKNLLTVGGSSDRRANYDCPAPMSPAPRLMDDAAISTVGIQALAQGLPGVLPPAARAETGQVESAAWPQWRGPTRDGQIKGPKWPDRLGADSFNRLWRVPLGRSYSGPIVSDDLVFTTETTNKESEAAIAFDRKTGNVRWRTEWKASMKVPFFAASNGSWIRSTPAFDGSCLYVAGMRDVLVCLDAPTGAERWRIDFVEKFQTTLPAFGFVSSPLLDGDAVFVQAGASVVKLKRGSGEVVWRVLKDEGGMYGSAFSSPVIAELAGKRQLLVQTREKLAGLDLETGAVLWTQAVPAFRGMNILTPVVVGDAVFTSSYQNKSWLFKVSAEAGQFRVSEAWSSSARGYMSTPVVIDGHAYIHLQNQRCACIDLKTGDPTWTSRSFGKYWSLVAQGNRILALEANGNLLLIEANPKKFELVDTLHISDADTWAHLAVSGEEVFVRELEALAAYRWRRTAKP